jgi:hypothetical protein
MRHLVRFLAFTLVFCGSAFAQPLSLPWKDGAAVADGWTMGQSSALQTPRYPLTAGTGVTAGMRSSHALFLTAERAPQQRYLERRIPLAAWRGKRLRATLWLKNQDKARGYASFAVRNMDESGMVPSGGAARTGFQQDGWEAAQVVLDVPGNARELVLHAGLLGSGTLWIDGPMLEAVGQDVAASPVRQIAPPPSGTDLAPPAPVATGPGAVALTGKWTLTNRLRPAALTLYWRPTRPIALRIESAGDATALSGDAQLRNANANTEPQVAFGLFGGMEREVLLHDWRGKRVRLTLRLQNEGGARAYVLAQVNQEDGDGARTLAQRNAPGSGGWEIHQFVLDVPEDGNYLYVYVGLTGSGRILAGAMTLEAVDRGAPLSPTDAVASGGPMSALAPEYSFVGQNNGGPGPQYTPPVSAPSPVGTGVIQK